MKSALTRVNTIIHQVFKLLLWYYVEVSWWPHNRHKFVQNFCHNNYLTWHIVIGCLLFSHKSPIFFSTDQSITWIVNSCGKNCGFFFFFFFLMWFYNFCLLRWQAIKWTISLSRGCIIYSMHQIKITVVKILFHWIYFFSKWRRSLMQSNPMHLWFGILFLDISWA